MNHYSLNESETVVPDETLAADEKERILAKTLAKAGLERAQGSAHSQAGADSSNSGYGPAESGSAASRSGTSAARRPKRKPWVLGIACVLVLGMATVSFAAMALDRNFFDFFSAKEPGQMEMLGNMGSLIDKQVTDNGLTLHVKEAVGDSSAVNVLFDIIAPEGTVLDADYYNFSSSFVDLPGSGAMGAGYYFEQLPDENPADNKLTMMLCYSTDTNLSGNTMRFRFSDLMTLKSAEEIDAIEKLPPRDEPGTPGDAYDYSKVIVSGNWEIEFPLNYTDASKTVKTDKTVQLFGGVCNIKEVRYSPLSATMVIQGSAIKKADETPESFGDTVGINLESSSLEEASGEAGGFEGTTDNELTVTLKDGSTVATNGTGTSTSNDKMTMTCQFSEIVDPADIASISYAGTTIDVQ